MDSINGTPLIWNNDRTKQLLGSIFKDFSGTQNFSDLPAFVDFGDSPFEGDCDGNCLHKSNFFEGVIDFEMLANDLDSVLKTEKFNYNKYVSDATKPMIVMGEGPFSVPVHKLSTYIDENGKVQPINIVSARLNRVECCVDLKPQFKVTISPQKCTYGLVFFYKDAPQPTYSLSDISNEIINTTSTDYIAIEIIFEKAEAFISFTRRISDTIKVDFLTNSISERFSKAFSQASKTPSYLNFLYKNAPHFVIKKRSEQEGADVLWNDLKILLTYDDTGFWSFLKDSSSAVINLLRGFDNSKILYKRFYNEPELIKRAYSDMDGTSEVAGELVDNRTAFVSLLTAISYDNLPELNFTGKIFYLGSGYKLDSNLSAENDLDPKKIFLEESFKTVYSEEYKRSSEFYKEKYRPKVITAPGEYYHPLDIVILVDEKGKKTLVPAIFVKNISDQFEEAEIAKQIRIGIDILVAAISLATLAAGGGVLWMILSAVELGLATTDAVIMSNESSFDPQFIALWNEIYTTGGALTALAATPAILRSFFSLSTRLLRTVTSKKARDLVIALMIRVVMEMKIANFVKGTLEFADAVQVSKLFPFRNSIRALTRLEENGVSFIKGVTSDGKNVEDGLIVIYEGEIIASGTAKEVDRIMGNIWKLNGKDLINYLDNFIDTVGKVALGESKLSNKGVKFRNTLPSPAHPGNIAVFEFKNAAGNWEIKSFTTLEKEEWVKLGYSDKPHAERMGVDWLKQNNIPNENVKAIYSELEPCMFSRHECKKMLKKFFPNASVSYSYDYPGDVGEMIFEKVRRTSINQRMKDLKKIFK